MSLIFRCHIFISVSAIPTRWFFVITWFWIVRIVWVSTRSQATCRIRGGELSNLQGDYICSQVNYSPYRCPSPPQNMWSHPPGRLERSHWQSVNWTLDREELQERWREETVMLLSGMWGKEKYRMNDYYERYVLHPLADTLELCSTCETFCQLFCQFLVLICKLIDWTLRRNPKGIIDQGKVYLSFILSPTLVDGKVDLCSK